jgi:excisionase family DNA binding protein
VPKQVEDVKDLTGLLKVDQVAQALGVAEGTCYRWIREGRLPVVRVGANTIRIDADALRSFLRITYQEGGPDVVVHSRQPAPSAALGAALGSADPGTPLWAILAELRAQSRALERIGAALGVTVEI